MPPDEHLEADNPAQMQRWCEFLGCTQQQLEEAIKAAGTEFAALREHLLNQGASAGVG